MSFRGVLVSGVDFHCIPGGLGLGNKIGNFSGYLRESRIEKSPQLLAEVGRGRVLPQS